MKRIEEAVKRYEALVILHNPTKDDGLKEAIDAVSAEITGHGGAVETVQKMDRKPFTRVVSKKYTSGFYTNFIFEVPAEQVSEVVRKISALEEVYRMMLTQASAAASAPAA